MTQLHEQYRPHTLADVVGQAKAIATIERIGKRGLGGRAYWVTGSTGTGLDIARTSGYHSSLCQENPLTESKSYAQSAEPVSVNVPAENENTVHEPATVKLPQEPTLKNEFIFLVRIAGRNLLSHQPAEKLNTARSSVSKPV